MVLESISGESPRRIARMAGFYLAVLAFVFFWLLAFNFVLYASIVGWFDPVLSDTVHFVHDIALATWVWVWGLAMVVQLYKPAKRVTAMQVALLLSVIDLSVGLVLRPALELVTPGLAFTGPQFDPSVLLFFGPVFVAAALHPARREVFELGGIKRTDVDPVLLGLAVLAAVPVVLYVLGQLRFQIVLGDEHAELGHYGTMTYYGLSMVALAGLAGVRNRGRRGAAYGAGLLATMLALASVFQPTMSGLDTTWSALAVLWALAVVGAYEWSVRRDAPSQRVVSTESPRAPS
ncbi:hypothetical protein [Halorarius litoreus]|uniref:hypothetical protein n=1 Tax=Halorarius litoreus TaxID=2962676 RepID=UPI0020CC9DE6|nr:hypothetical protein [Halorarius litoreus]